MVVLMRFMPYLVKIHGRYSAQRKVPEDLQREVARLLGTGRERQVYLKRFPWNS
jgi:hypothetical protein